MKFNQTFFEEKNQWKLIIFEINDVTGVEKLGTEQNFVLFQVSANKSNPNQQRSRVHVSEISNDLERGRCHLQCCHREKYGHVRRNCPEMYKGRRPFRYQNASKPPYNYK